jgi:hypothetical protein
MADYYPLIARAVASLEKNTGENRRALYERARTALVAQLRGVVPALAESDITRERLALEEAIRKVEGEAARRPRVELPRDQAAPARAPEPRREDIGRPARGEPSPPPRAPRPPEPEMPRAEPHRPRPAWPEPPRPQPSPPPRAEPPRAEPFARRDLPRAQPPRGEAPSPRQQPPRFEPPRGQPQPPRFPPAGAEPPPRTAPPGAGAARNRAPWPEPPPAEPSWEPPPHEPQPAEPMRMPPMRGEALRNLAGAPETEARRGPIRQRPAAEEPPAEWPMPQEFDRLEPQIATEDFEAAQRGIYPEALEPVVAEPRFGPRPRPARRESEEEAVVRPRRGVSYGPIVKIAAAVVLVAALGAGAYWQRANIISVYQAFRGSSQPAHDAAAAKPKISDRIGGEATPGAGPSGQPAAAVAQRVVLYEEEADNPQGKRFVGSAIWRTETVTPGAGQPPQLAVRADVEIPERRMTMTFSIRRNTDRTLPASHTIEITFNIPADFPGGGIGNVPGVLMKQAEQTRGVPLAGLAVKVTSGFFLIGLSAVESDVQRNVQLLKERSWLDIPLVYANNQRAILAIEKGTPGERAFDEAFVAWERASTSAK